MITASFSDIKDFIKGRVFYNEPMKKHTSFRTGGPAELWIEPEDIASLKACLALAKEKNMPLFVFGGGTNILVRDEGIKGMVISLTSSKLKKIYHGGSVVIATAALRLIEFLRFLADNNLSGLEFLAGVPGTVGGAVTMNAGGYHYAKKDAWKSIGDLAEEIKALDYEGNEHILRKSDFNFGYKTSGLNNFVVTEVKFAFIKDDKKKILKEYTNFLRKKMLTQDLRSPSAGCVFKNPTGIGVSAGELIDKCGLKGRRAGGALVSSKHANFIINANRATSGDIIELMSIVRDEVKKNFSIELKPEIKIV